MSGFPAAYGFVLQQEKGDYAGDEARDPNPTRDGVTQRRYNRWRTDRGLKPRSVFEMDEAERTAVYHEEWEVSKADYLPGRAATALYDHAINAGPMRAVQVLQRVVGVKDDGVFGPQTLAAVRHFVGAHGEDALFQSLQWERLRYYLAITDANRRLRPNLASWLRRVLALTEGGPR